MIPSTTREKGLFHCEGPSRTIGYYNSSPRLMGRKEKVSAFSGNEALSVKKRPTVFYWKENFYIKEGVEARLLPPALYHDLLQGISVPLVFCEECQQLLNALLKVKEAEKGESTFFSSLKEALFAFFHSHTVLKACLDLHLNRSPL